MKRKFMRPYFAIITAIVFWGISYISTDICVTYMQPITLATLRSVIAAVILFVIWKIASPKVRVQKKHFFRFFASGFIGIVCYFIFEIYGVKYASPSVAAIILAAIPIISLIADRVISKNKFTLLKIAGVLISLFGVALVIGVHVDGLSRDGKIIGYLCMFGAAISWVAFNYLSNPLYKDYSPLTITTFQMISGAITLVPIFLATKEPLPPLNQHVIINVAFLAVFCSAVGILLYMYALKNLGIVTTTLFINIQPFVTVVASMIVLREFLEINQIMGGLLVISAVYLSSFTTPKNKKETEVIQKNV